MISEREGMPNTILEYMAAGLPVVATDLPGIREMVRAGETGYIVPVRDPEAVARALRTLLSDDRARERMGRAGRHVLEGGMFTTKSEVEEIERLLFDVGAR